MTTACARPPRIARRCELIEVEQRLFLRDEIVVLASVRHRKQLRSGSAWIAHTAGVGHFNAVIRAEMNWRMGQGTRDETELVHANLGVMGRRLLGGIS